MLHARGVEASARARDEKDVHLDPRRSTEGMAEASARSAPPDMEEELKLLQRYQCQPEQTDLEAVAHMLAKASVCGAGHIYLTLLPEWMRRETQLKHVVELAKAIDAADFDTYWKLMRTNPELKQGKLQTTLVDGARKHVLKLVQNTYQSIALQDMQRLLDMDETQAKDLFDHMNRENAGNEWTVDQEKNVHVPVSPNNHPQPRKGRDTINWKQVEPLLG